MRLILKLFWTRSDWLPEHRMILGLKGTRVRLTSFFNPPVWSLVARPLSRPTALTADIS